MQTTIKISTSTSTLSIVFLIFLMSMGCQQNQRTPLIKASIKVTGICKAGNTCGTWLSSLKKANAIEITNQSFAWYPSLRYEIFPCSGPNPTCLPIVTFVCNQQVVTYASTNLTNGAAFYVKLTDTNSINSTGYNFTNLSSNDQICDGGSGGTGSPE